MKHIKNISTFYGWSHISFVVLILLFMVPFQHMNAGTSTINDGKAIVAYGTTSAYLIDYTGAAGFYELYWWDAVDEEWDLKNEDAPSIRQMDIYNDGTNLIGTDNNGVIQLWDGSGMDASAWSEPYGSSDKYDWVLYEPMTYKTMGLMEDLDAWKELYTPVASGGDPWYEYMPVGVDVSDRMKNVWLVDNDYESSARWEKKDINYYVTLNRESGSTPFKIYYYGDSDDTALGLISGRIGKGSNVDTVIVKQISYDELNNNLWGLDTSGIPWQWSNADQEWIQRATIATSGVCTRGLVLVDADLTDTGQICGDLKIINGSMIINDPGGLVVEGDVKILSGNIYMGPVSGPLSIFGDLIITNTNPAYHSTVITHSSLHVTGGIYLNSVYGQATITTTGAAAGDGDIKAAALITRGYENSSVYTGSDITIVGEIDLNSTDSHACVWVQTGTLRANSIKTYAQGDGYVLAEDIFAVGDIDALAIDGDAYVKSEATDIYAHRVTTSAGMGGYLIANGGIDVLGAVSLTSTGDDAYVLASGTTITAGSIVTDAYDDGSVEAQNLLLVNGNVNTRSSAGDANVLCNAGPVIAINVATDAYADGSISADASSNINVRRNINLFSSGGAADVKNNLNLLSTSVTTSGGGSAYVNSDGTIRVAGVINTYSPVSSYVKSDNGGDIFAESILTTSGNARVDSANDIFVKDMLRVKTADNDAYVVAANDIFSRSVTTSAGLSGYVKATGGSIDVVGDVRTHSDSGDAYVEASADVDARSIKTTAPSGSDDYIKAGPGSGSFRLLVDSDNTGLTVENSEFYLNSDRVWNTLLSIEGSCTFNGNGCRFELVGSGGIEVKSGASLLLKNIKFDDMWGSKIRCEDNTATLSVMNVYWTQTGDTMFDTGSIQLLGDFVIDGSGTTFLFESSETTSVLENSAFIFSPGVTLSYNSDSQQNIWLSDASSRIMFDDAYLFATKDVRFTTGRVVFDNHVTFSVSPGRICYFGGNNSAYNVSLDTVLSTEFEVFGAILDENIY